MNKSLAGAMCAALALSPDRPGVEPEFEADTNQSVNGPDV